MPHPKNRKHFGLYSTNKRPHMKVGSKTRCLRVRLIKTLTNPPRFELGLMVGAKRAFLSVTRPNDFQAYSFDKSVNFVMMRQTLRVIINYG